MRKRTCAAAIVVIALLIACGGGSDQQAIRETVEGFFQALGEDREDAYAYLAQACTDEVSLSNFDYASELAVFLSVNDVSVENVEIVEREGDEIVANVDVAVALADQAPVGAPGLGKTRFVREKGRWRFSDCAAFRAVEAGPPADGPAAEADDDPTLPGEYINLPEIYGGPYPDTASHVQRQIDYIADGNSNPPAGGPHWGSGACTADPDDAPPFCGPASWGIYRTPWEPETLVHNMEHAGIVLWYNTADQAIVDQLEELFVDRLNDGQLLVMAPYPDMEDEHIALTSWSRIDKFPVAEYSSERVEEFIDAHERRFNPEGF